MHLSYFPFRSRLRCQIFWAAFTLFFLLSAMLYHLSSTGFGGLEDDSEAALAEMERELVRELRERAREEEEPLETGEEEAELEKEVVLFGELDPNEIPPNHGLFFFLPYGAKDLSLRQTCSVESAASLHPASKVFVVFLSSDVVDVLDNDALSALVTFDNVVIRFIKLENYFTHTSMRKWLLSSDFQKNPDLSTQQAHLGHALAYVFLSKFGGTVLSFGHLLRRPLLSLGLGLGGFVSRCRDDSAEASPIAMDREHPLAKDLLEQMVNYYVAEDAESTGAAMITKRLKHLCDVSYLNELLYKSCPHSLKLLSTDVFCPMEKEKHWMIVDEIRTKLVMKCLRERQSYGLNLWLRQNEPLNSWGSSDHPTAFFRLAEEVCPLTVQILNGGRF